LLQRENAHRLNNDLDRIDTKHSLFVLHPLSLSTRHIYSQTHISSINTATCALYITVTLRHFYARMRLNLDVRDGGELKSRQYSTMFTSIAFTMISRMRTGTRLDGIDKADERTSIVAECTKRIESTTHRPSVCLFFALNFIGVTIEMMSVLSADFISKSPALL
jgi:hypothetical protein